MTSPSPAVQVGVSTFGPCAPPNLVVGMKLVVFGLSVSSSWGNGHATLWRGLIRALAELGHRVVFYERDVPYYAEHRDLLQLDYGELKLYTDWEGVTSEAQRDIGDADASIVTSYCPDGAAASDLVLAGSSGLRVFYDLDTPITLERLRRGEPVLYLPVEGLAGFELVLSYTGGVALDELRQRLGARRVVPLYGSVDPRVHYPVAPVERYRADLSYLGTYAEDRQDALLRLLIEPARRLATGRFLIGGAKYPQAFPWSDNIFFVRHLPPSEHCAFYCSSRVTLNVTRAPMAVMGYCPSGRLFEAAACGAVVLSDSWQGLNEFFEPRSEILVANTTDDALAALEVSDAELARISRAARERVLSDHTAERRALQLVSALEGALTVEA
jgi:spore maturation protein CgeB